LYWKAPSDAYDAIVAPEVWALETLPDRLHEVLREVRGAIDSDRIKDLSEEINEVYSMASEMVLRYFAGDVEVSEWSDWCSTLSLDIHQQFDEISGDGDTSGRDIFYPAGTMPDLTLFEGLELKDQVVTLLSLGEGDPVARRSVLEIARRGNERSRLVMETVIQDM
jgi:hypothetical protein